ncbi:MAG: hypothetical protein MRERV_8c025 [Mycoplasmataceae bacterium RV_VA103A]|nr:MAG: hypothetical protein MRERV_8c025 [Mycoplasmataceae bacterium RV_VA103A]
MIFDLLRIYEEKRALMNKVNKIHNIFWVLIIIYKI